MNWERWGLEWTHKALDELERLDRRTQARIVRTVARFAETGYGDVDKIESRNVKRET